MHGQLRCAVILAVAAVMATWAYGQAPQADTGPNAVNKSPTATAPAPPPASAPSEPVAEAATTESAPTSLGKVVVSGKLAQEQIAPSLGAVTYTLGPEQIQAIPGGENAPLQQVLLRAPGVVQDSFGQEHVRGEHGNLTYRVNGVLLPQPLSGFGQELDTRLIQSLTLIDGSLPAQFGFHTSGIVDVVTKSGATLQHNELSLYGGSNDTMQSSFQFGGTAGKLDYFVVGSQNHNGLGIENPTGTHRAIHDYTNQEKFFGYFAYPLDDTSRLSLLLNISDADFQIPNTPGVDPAFTLNGVSTGNSRTINENQNEQNYYAVLAYQKVLGDASFQLSGFTSYGQIDFRPDVHNDLIFQGVAGHVFNNYVTNGVQWDGSLAINEQHTIRGGFIADYTAEALNTNAFVFPANQQFMSDNLGQTMDTPIDINDQTRNHALESGLYLQDEWSITRQFTLNYGLRYDRYDANFDSEGQWSPRANMVFKIDDKTTAHAGYARYFVTPPVQDVHSSSVRQFAFTTNAPFSLTDDPPRAERSNYYDIGIGRKLTSQWQVNVDGFYKHAHNLLDEGQFGAPVIETPFNYRKGTVFGSELSTTYTNQGLSLYGNFSWVRTSGTDINSQQFQFDPEEFSYIQTHNIHLDHESEYTVSAGASYHWRDDRVYIDFLSGSGLRRGFANTEKLAPYYPVNVGYEHVFHADAWGKNQVRLRFDVVNIFDQKYELRDGSGIGVGAPQFGQRLGFYAGIAYEF